MKVKDLKLSVIAVALSAGTLMGGAAFTPANACSGEETYVGSVCAMAANYCPKDYMKAEGQILAISQYSALYAYIGDAYGGNGTTTFGLPDLRGRTPVGLGTSYHTTVNRGTKRGAESVTLTESQLTAHNHYATLSDAGDQALVDINVSKEGADVTTPADGDFFATPSYDSFVSPSGKGETVELGGSMTSVSLKGPLTIQNTGGNTPISLQTPYTTATYCIRAEGLYPPRP